MTLKDVYAARERMADAVHETGFFSSATFSALSGCKMYLKCENMQKTGSFKVRGAYNKIAKLCKTQKLSAVVAASAGNHAQGVAYAAAAHGIPSVIVMPRGTPIAKISATAGYGAQTELFGEYYDDACAHAMQIAQEKKAKFIHPFDDEDIIAGQATLAVEMLNAKPDLDTIIVPAGGGGLLAGVAFAAKQIKPSVKVYGVQAEKADAIKQSFNAKKLIAHKDIFTIADGIAVKKPGALTLAYILKYADGIFTVSDDEIAETIILLLERGKMAVEPAGAASLALAVSKKLDLAGKKAACILSGGNIDVGFVHKIIEKGLISRGRQMKLSVVLPDKPGALEGFAGVMGRNNANIISVQYDRSSAELRLNETILHIAFEAAGHEHGKQVIKNLQKAGFVLAKG